MNKLANALMGHKNANAQRGYGVAQTQGAGETQRALGDNAPAASMPTTAPPMRGLGPVAGAPPVAPATPRPPSPTAPAGMMTGTTNLASGLAQASPLKGTSSTNLPGKISLASEQERAMHHNPWWRLEPKEAQTPLLNPRRPPDYKVPQPTSPNLSTTPTPPSGSSAAPPPALPTPSAPVPQPTPRRTVTAAARLRAELMRGEMPANMKPIEPPSPPKPPKPFQPKAPGTTKDFTLGSTAGTI